MGQRRRFTPEFKRQAVQLLNASQRPAAEIARELGIPRNRLYKWQKESKGSGVIVDRLVRARLLFFARPSLLVC